MKETTKLPKGFIVVTNIYYKSKPRILVLNTNQIGSLSPNDDGTTNIGITTHNNGGFDAIKETIEEIVAKMIESQK